MIVKRTCAVCEHSEEYNTEDETDYFDRYMYHVSLKGIKELIEYSEEYKNLKNYCWLCYNCITELFQNYPEMVDKIQKVR